LFRITSKKNFEKKKKSYPNNFFFPSEQLFGGDAVSRLKMSVRFQQTAAVAIDGAGH